MCRRCHVDVAKVQDFAARSRETLKKKRRDRISKSDSISRLLDMYRGPRLCLLVPRLYYVHILD